MKTGNELINFCWKYKNAIGLLSAAIGCMIILISWKVFGNDYWGTRLHWYVVLIHFGIWYFVNFCIVEASESSKTDKTTKPNKV